MKVIAGLGNPGSKYEGTRHNIGFVALDRLAQELNIRVNRIKFQALMGEGRLGTERLLLVKPQTYMNRSGQSIGEVCRYYKVPPEDLLIFVDDIDIAFASLKIKKKGSAGTHNGLKSVIEHVGSEDFPRIKIGVGAQDPTEDLAEFVLSPFSQKEQKHMQAAIDASVEAALVALKSGIHMAMNQYNNRTF